MLSSGCYVIFRNSNINITIRYFTIKLVAYLAFETNSISKCTVSI